MRLVDTSKIWQKKREQSRLNRGNAYIFQLRISFILVCHENTYILR